MLAGVQPVQRGEHLRRLGCTLPNHSRREWEPFNTRAGSARERGVLSLLEVLIIRTESKSL